jgi:hypothetical protein
MRDIARKALVASGITAALVLGPGVGMAHAQIQIPVPEIPIPPISAALEAVTELGAEIGIG